MGVGVEVEVGVVVGLGVNVFVGLGLGVDVDVGVDVGFGVLVEVGTALGVLVGGMGVGEYVGIVGIDDGTAAIDGLDIILLTSLPKFNNVPTENMIAKIITKIITISRSFGTTKKLSSEKRRYQNVFSNCLERCRNMSIATINMIATDAIPNATMKVRKSNDKNDKYESLL